MVEKDPTLTTLLDKEGTFPIANIILTSGTMHNFNDLLQGRIVLGNHLTEYSLVLYFTKAEAHYSTTAVSP